MTRKLLVAAAIAAVLSASACSPARTAAKTTVGAGQVVLGAAALVL